MNVKFSVQKVQKRYSSILVRFWDSKRIDQTTSTGFHVKFKEFDNKKQKVKISIEDNNADEINHRLDKLERHIVNKYNSDFNSNTYISKTWLKETVNSFFQRVDANDKSKTYFVDWIDIYVSQIHKQLNNGKPLSNNTVKNYKGVLKKLQEFEKYKAIRIKHEDIDLNFYRDFMQFCSKELKLSNNSINSYITKIKTFCKNIELEGLPVNPMYKHKNFRAPTNETFDIYLSNDEIESIFKYDFSHSERLENARDLFIIGLRTGLRISDISKLTKDNFLKNMINITTTKTNHNLNIPIHHNVKTILDKRNGELPQSISDQKFNKYIKEISQIVGINEKVFGSKIDETTKRKKEGYYEKWELVKSHTCRRSMATNLFLDGVATNLIMSATGHRSIKDFKRYIKASQQQHIDVISKKWEEQNKKQ